MLAATWDREFDQLLKNIKDLEGDVHKISEIANWQSSKHSQNIGLLANILSGSEISCVKTNTGPSRPTGTPGTVEWFGRANSPDGLQGCRLA